VAEVLTPSPGDSAAGLLRTTRCTASSFGSVGSNASACRSTSAIWAAMAVSIGILDRNPAHSFDPVEVAQVARQDVPQERHQSVQAARGLPPDHVMRNHVRRRVSVVRIRACVVSTSSCSLRCAGVNSTITVSGLRIVKSRCPAGGSG